MKQNRGQAMVELVLGMILCVPLLLGGIRLCRTIFLKGDLHAAARLGAFLTSLGLVSDHTVQSEMSDYLTHLKRTHGLPVRTEVARFRGTSASRFYNLHVARVEAALGASFAGLPSVRESVVVQK